MTHKSGQVKLPLLHTERSATTSKDYQRNDRNTREAHLQTFSDFLQKLHSKRERFTAAMPPAGVERGKLDPPVGTESHASD